MEAPNRPDLSVDPENKQIQSETPTNPGEAKRKADKEFFEHQFRSKIRGEAHRQNEDGSVTEIASYDTI